MGVRAKPHTELGKLRTPRATARHERGGPHGKCWPAGHSVINYITRLFDYVEQGDLDPAKLITHDVPLDEGVRAYDLFKNKKDNCIRVAMRPGV